MPAAIPDGGGGSYPVAPAPQIFWLNGKAYYSLAAYEAALASQAAAVPKSAPAPAPAPKPVAAPAPAPKPVSASLVSAADLAYRRAEQVRRQQELLRLQAAARAKLLAASAARAAETRRLLLAARGTRANPETLTLSRQAEQVRRNRDAQLASSRHLAYQNLQSEVNAGLATAGFGSPSQLAASRRFAYQKRHAQERSATGGQRYQDLLSEVAAGTASASRLASFGSTFQRQRQAVAKGSTTGNWSDAIDILSRQSSESGGRYVDQGLLDTVNERYVTQVNAVGHRFEDAMKEAHRLLSAGDMAGLRKLIDSPDFTELEDLFTRYFGDGRTPGSFAPHADALTKIAEDRERLWMGMLLDPSGNTTSAEGIQALLDKAQADSVIHGRSGRTDQGIVTSPTRQMTYREQGLDLATGKMKTVVKVGLDAYLAREFARQQDQQRLQFEQQTQRLHDLALRQREADRPMSASVDASGHLVSTDLRQKAMLDELYRIIPGAKSRLDLIEGAKSPAAREELVRNLLRDAAGAYEREHASDPGSRIAEAYASGTHGRYGVGGVARDAWLTELKRALMGPNAGSYGLMDDLSASYGLGDIFRAAQSPLAGIISSVRQMRAEGLFGNKPDFGRPFIDVSLFGDKGLQASAGQESDPGGKKAYQEYIRGINDPDPNVQANARRAYGLGYVGGNLGWLAEGAIDPLNLVAPSAWLNRARLAVAATSGWHGLSRLENSLAEFARYSAPRAIGGYGASKLRNDLAKMALGRDAGISATEALRMGDDSIHEMLEKAARGADELAASDAFKKLFEASGIDREQLLNIVQDKLPGLADEFRLLAVDPFEMHAQIRAAREGFAQAEQLAKEAAQLEVRRVAQAEAKAAPERVRVAAGPDIAKRFEHSAAQVAGYESRLARYVGAAKDYAAVAGRAARAADELDVIGQMAKVDRRRLVNVYAQLKRSLHEMQVFEDSFVTKNGVRELDKPGLITKHYNELARYKLEIHGDPSAPSYVGLAWNLVRQDRRMLTSRIRGLQRALASAKDEVTIQGLRTRLIEAHKARVGVEFESALLDRGRSMARGYGKRNIDRVSRAYRPQRLGQKALDEVQRGVEVSRDISSRLGSVSEVTHAPAISGGEAKAFKAAGVSLDEATGADVVGFIQSLIQRKVNVRFGKVSAADVIASLERLAADMGVELKDLTLSDLLVALHRVRLNADDFDLWEGVLRAVESRVLAALKSSGWTRSVDDYISELGWQHVRDGATGSLSKLEGADKRVADALFALRGRRAEGLRLGGGKHNGDAALRELLRPDTKPAVVLTKIRALRGEGSGGGSSSLVGGLLTPPQPLGGIDLGMSVFEYDELRGALRSIMNRKRTAGSLLVDAESIAMSKGAGLDEAYLQARSARARAESLREFEEFASRAENQGLVPEQLLRLFEEKYVSSDLGQVPGLQLTSYQDAALRTAWRDTTGFDFADAARRSEWLQGTNGPPLGNRVKMRDWLVENGYWSLRTREQIASGERVWSIDDERKFFEDNWGYTPLWTDREVMRVLLRDRTMLKAALDEWGFFEDGFEPLFSALDLKHSMALDVVSWGRAGVDGVGKVSAKRTLPEMRQWVVQRYGDLVGSIAEDGSVHLTDMPWLMNEAEYFPWMERALSESGRSERMAALTTARERLPKVIRDAMPTGDDLSHFGIDVDRGLVKTAEIEKLNKVLVAAVRRRLKKLIENSDLDPGDWLPQEQLRFAYDVTNDLLADPVWRGFLRGVPVAGAVLHVIGQVQRALVSFQPAFPIMNLIEVYGPRRALLAVFYNGFRPLSFSGEGRRLASSLRELGLEPESLFYLADGAKPWLRVGDKMLPAATRGKAALSTVLQAPLQASAFGENALRLDFARSVAGRAYRDAVRSGMEVVAAEALARAEAKRMVSRFFLTQGDSGLMRAINNVIPFFSYNLNNKRLAMRMIWEHPAIALWGQRIADEVKSLNRDAWEKENPGVPFPENDPSSSWLWLRIGKDWYTVDLSQFSDWTRSLKSVMSSQNALGWANSFLRAPHPLQLAIFAFLTGGVTPWGKPGHIRELGFWADLLFYMNGVDYADPRWKRNWIQITSQMLFFQKFGRITPIKAKLQQYFWFRDLDVAKARSYLSENPDLQIYFDSLAGPGRASVFAEKVTSFWALLSDAEREDYTQSFDAWTALNKTLDDRIFAFANQPWSQEYADAKREALIARTAFLDEHPILADSWGVYMSPAEFAALEDGWRVDALAEAWFNWERPTKAAYKTELSYQQALVDYYDKRETFLEANPALAKRLLTGRNAVENAWREQELQWSAILQFQAELKVRILEEQEKPSGDPDLVDLLYRVKDAASLELDAESYAQVYGAVIPGGMLNQSKAQALISIFGSSGQQLIKRVARLPGFSDFIYGRSTPEERANIEHNDWYARSLAGVMAKATDGKSFYGGLFANPALLQEYWRRNPDAKARYQAGQEYFRWISSWVKKLQADNFVQAQSVWDAMPAWVRQRYLDGHPNSGMHDGMGGGGASTAVQYKGRWFKSSGTRDRYIRWVENGGTGAVPAEFAGSSEHPGFRSAESRARFIRGQEYFASIGRWVELLKAKDFVGADRYFGSMPSWMKEKYYAKHPGQRAQHELTSDSLRRGAEYFLASGDDKLAILAKYPAFRAWLVEHGGEEAAFRGLVVAIYRAIPSSEAWLKRTFRSRFSEVFGQQALGVRRLAGVLHDLARNPEMEPFYARALALQSSLYTEQLKHSKVAPKPWEMVRKKRAVKRSRRRGARLHSNWTLHRDLRHQR